MFTLITDQCVGNVWECVAVPEFSSDSFTQVDDDLVGYAHWDESWKPNECKTNEFVFHNELNLTSSSSDDETVECDVVRHCCSLFWLVEQFANVIFALQHIHKHYTSVKNIA